MSWPTAALRDYDHLIISTGPRLALERVEGPGLDAWTPSICHLDPSVRSAEK